MKGLNIRALGRRFYIGFGSQQSTFGQTTGVAPQSDPPFSPPILLNAAAAFRAEAVSEGEVVNAARVGMLNWKECLYQTEYSLYMQGCAYWRYRTGVDGRFLIDLLEPTSVSVRRDGYYFEGERIPPSEMVAFRRFISPPRAVDRLMQVSAIERSALSAIEKANKDMATKPRYWLHLKNARPPKTEEESAALNTRLAKAMGSVVAPTFGEEMLDVMPITRDEQTPSDINEVRRWIASDSGVPPPLLGSPDSQTFANLGTLVNTFWTVIILPEAARIASAVRQQGVLPDFDINYSAAAALGQQRLERADLRNKQAAAFKQLRGAGVDWMPALKLSGLAAEWEAEGYDLAELEESEPEPMALPTGGEEQNAPPPRMLYGGRRML